MADEEEEDEPSSLRPPTWRLNLVLFVATAASVFLIGATESGDGPVEPGVLGALRALPHGWRFAVPLLAILLTHEFGHFIAARLHGVDASLPYFIPLPSPQLGPFGTMGAVIHMRGRIRSRDALLDIGASGPLAGLVVALPVLAYGLAHSPVMPNSAHGVQEGQCLLYLAMKRLFVGPIPDGYDVFLSPTALAGWAGLLVTMMNLVPVAQLDGGHIAYALFGPRQDRFAGVVHKLLLGVFGYNLVRSLAPLLRAHEGLDGGLLHLLGTGTLFWLTWYLLLLVMMRLSGKNHPETDPGELRPIRKGLAVLSLAMFVLLFMPTPWARY